MINGKLVKSYIDRKASLPYQALSTKKVAPAEKGVDGKLEFANAARHSSNDRQYLANWGRWRAGDSAVGYCIGNGE